MFNFSFKNLENPMIAKVSDTGNFRNSRILSSMQICYSILEFNKPVYRYSSPQLLHNAVYVLYL